MRCSATLPKPEETNVECGGGGGGQHKQKVAGYRSAFSSRFPVAKGDFDRDAEVSRGGRCQHQQICYPADIFALNTADAKRPC